MTMTLWVVRHGQTEANARGLLLGRADPSLDDLGREQAAKIAAAMPTPDRVVSSPLGRTMQTAAAFGVDVEVEERLVELDYGDYDLTPVSEVDAETWRQWRTDLDFRPPNGETMNEMYTRVASALSDLQAAGAGTDHEENIVVVSHVSPIKASLCWALGVGPATMWRSWVAQASITRIGLSERGPTLHGFNDIRHLT